MDPAALATQRLQARPSLARHPPRNVLGSSRCGMVPLSGASPSQPSSPPGSPAAQAPSRRRTRGTHRRSHMSGCIRLWQQQQGQASWQQVGGSSSGAVAAQQHSRGSCRVLAPRVLDRRSRSVGCLPSSGCLEVEAPPEASSSACRRLGLLSRMLMLRASRALGHGCMGSRRVQVGSYVEQASIPGQLRSTIRSRRAHQRGPAAPALAPLLTRRPWGTQGRRWTRLRLGWRRRQSSTVPPGVKAVQERTKRGKDSAPMRAGLASSSAGCSLPLPG